MNKSGIWVYLLYSDGEGNGNPLLHSCLKKPMDRGAWQAIVHGVAKSLTWLGTHKHTIFRISCIAPEAILPLFLKKILFYLFNWRIIALQCCVGFCLTTTQISHKCTYTPSLLNLHPTSHPIPLLQVVMERQVELPVLNSSCPLVLCMVM